MEPKLFPREVTSDLPRITLTGKERVQVEQHRGLLSYLPEEIVLLCSQGKIRVAGNQLQMKRYTRAEALIEGEISGVWVEDGGAKP